MVFPSLFRAAILGALAPALALAHCDGLDGPVVTDARLALTRNDVDRVLRWVGPTDEGAIRAAFARTQAVRKLGGEARDLADQHFFETLVRLHRAGEGEAYTGLKPAGRDLGPAIPAGDKALETGDLKPVWDLLRETAHQGLHRRFEAVRKARLDRDTSPEAGRAFVAAYVDYIHYLAELHARAGAPGAAAEPRETRAACGD